MIYQTLISVDALLALRAADQDVLLFDCDFDLGDTERGRRLFLEGHVPGARYLHLNEDLSATPDGRNGRHPLPGRAEFAATLRAHGLSSGRQVVAYDAAGGPYASRLWWMLRWLGHEAVAVLDGGTAAWLEAGLPTESGPMPVVPAGDFQPGEPRVAAPVSAAGLLATRGSDALLVVDARTPERFRGEPHPLDPVSGHIPGARNRFFRDNLDARGHFKPAEQLAREFAEVLRGQPPACTVMQCGSGVTACHNALAMSVAGLAGTRLYPGSWSEWISDPARPIERG